MGATIGRSGEAVGVTASGVAGADR